jgi:hypothetical protein
MENILKAMKSWSASQIPDQAPDTYIHQRGKDIPDCGSDQTRPDASANQLPGNQRPSKKRKRSVNIM